MYTKIESQRARYYLGECDWNLRAAIDLSQKDVKWEKQKTLATLCEISMEDAKQLLDRHTWDVHAAHSYWKKHDAKKLFLFAFLKHKKYWKNSTWQ